MRIISSSQLCGGGSYRAEVFSFLLLHNKSPHSCLKRTNFFSWLLWVRSLAWLSWVLCLGYHKATIKLSAGAQMSVLRSCRTEGFTFLLTVSWSPSSAPRGQPQFLATMGLATKAAHNMAACFFKARKGLRDVSKTSVTILYK